MTSPISRRIYTVSVEMPQNARAHATVLLRNSSDRPQKFQLKLAGDIASRAELSVLTAIEYVPDLPQSITPDTILSVGSGETVGLEVTLSSAGSVPGEYAGVMTLIPLDGRFAIREMAVTQKVYPVVLPEQLPIRVFQWDYASVRDRARRDFLLNARVNTFHVSLFKTPAEEDFAQLDEVVASLKERLKPGEFQLIVEAWFVREGGGWRSDYVPWLDRLIARMKDHGLSSADWSLEIYDEVLNDAFYESAVAIKQSHPQVRIFSDCIVTDPEVIEKFAPVLDIWCPLATQIPPYREDHDAALAAMRRSNLPIWLYNCDPKPQQPLSLYRLQPWLAWRNGFTGCNFWTTNPAALRNTPEVPNYGMTYRDAKGQWHPSRRWNMWRAGLEDYLLLHLVAAKAEMEGKPELLRRARELADQVLSSRESSELGRILNEARRELLEMASH